MDGDLWKTAKFIDNVRLPYIAPSLGGVESLIEQPTVIRWVGHARTRLWWRQGRGFHYVGLLAASASHRCRCVWRCGPVACLRIAPT